MPTNSTLFEGLSWFKLEGSKNDYIMVKWMMTTTNPRIMNQKNNMRIFLAIPIDVADAHKAFQCDGNLEWDIKKPGNPLRQKEKV